MDSELYVSLRKRLSARRLVKIAVALYLLKGLLKSLSRVRKFHAPNDLLMKSILNGMPAYTGYYFPTLWAHDSWSQMALMMLWKARRSGSVRFNREVLRCADGGEVALDEYREAVPGTMASLPIDSPVLLILHTITARPGDECEFCAYAASRGWRPVVMLRRGHFGPLASAKFNIIGCAEDTALMAARVRQRYPSAFIGAVGLSAGSGQVVSYIGQQHGREPVQAAVSLCPAWDIRGAFPLFDARSPMIARFVVNSIKRLFVLPNEKLLGQVPGYAAVMASHTMQGFVETAVGMAGSPTYESYLAESNPMSHFHNSEVRHLKLNRGFACTLPPIPC